MKSIPLKIRILKWDLNTHPLSHTFFPPGYLLAPPWIGNLCKIGWVLRDLDLITGLVLLCVLVSTNNTQTKYIQLAKRLWVRVQVQPIFFIWMFNMGIAYGAQVGLKLRLQLGMIFFSADQNSVYETKCAKAETQYCPCFATWWQKFMFSAGTQWYTVQRYLQN